MKALPLLDPYFEIWVRCGTCTLIPPQPRPCPPSPAPATYHEQCEHGLRHVEAMAPVVVGDPPVPFAHREQEPHQHLREGGRRSPGALSWAWGVPSDLLGGLRPCSPRGPCPTWNSLVSAGLRGPRLTAQPQARKGTPAGERSVAAPRKRSALGMGI